MSNLFGDVAKVVSAAEGAVEKGAVEVKDTFEELLTGLDNESKAALHETKAHMEATLAAAVHILSLPYEEAQGAIATLGAIIRSREKILYAASITGGMNAQTGNASQDKTVGG